MLQMRTSRTLWRSYRRNRMPWVYLLTGSTTISLSYINLIWLIALQRRMFSVFMCVYIPLQLRSEKQKQTPVIETSPQISMVPVRTRRSVPACLRVGMRLCVYVGARYAAPQLNPSNPSTSCLHAGMMLTVPAFLWTMLLLSTDITLDRRSSQQQSVSQVHTQYWT